MSSNPADGSLESLKAVVKSTTSLISRLESHVYATATDSGSGSGPDSDSGPDAETGSGSGSGSVDVLSLAHDSAKLIKAHVTKLSLLIINEPFTPSAIAKVLRELVAAPVPAIASAVQRCATDTHTAVVRNDLAWKCYRILKELGRFIDTIPLDGKILPDHRKNGANGDKGSIVHTGIIWAACDDVIQLKGLGVAGLLQKKLEEYRDTLQDMMEELKEWGEEVGEDAEEGDPDGQPITDDFTQDIIDDLMRGQPIPRNDPNGIRERLDSCLKRLRLTILFYSAIIKRRIKTLPSLPVKQAAPVTQRLNEVFPVLKNLTGHFEDISFAFYSLDARDIDGCLDTCFFDAFAAAEMLKAPWTGTQDGFTEWADKYQISIKKPE
ncbi:hypothetical protein F5B17DRAFT_166904 [Nemania serpens]|nr:hypothetical protein F5B17DRAFT_166904 [Nemania serpens]